MVGVRARLVGAVLLAAQCGAMAAAPLDWEAGARKTDAAYWKAYNDVDPKALNAFLADDVEFYHDRGGTLIGKKALAAVNDGMDKHKTTLRREAIPGTVKFFPMRKGEQIYGALVSGEHQFFVKPVGKPESLAGRAYFTQLMVLKGQTWKISRIFSYEHLDAGAAAPAR